MSDEPMPSILVVDDTEGTRYILARTLAQAGFTVTQAATGWAALSQLSTNRPDVVILDVQLPDISGHDVCRKLKQNIATSSLPVLQVSAHFKEAGDLVRGLEGGADAYLTHPIDPLVLVATVRALLRTARAERELKAAKLRAEEASKAKDHFLAVLSHELRTPLTPVLAAVTMLQEGKHDPQTLREGLDMIRRNAEMEARLIDDLLDVTRIMRGKIELQRSTIRVRDLIQRAIDVCLPDMHNRNLQFTADLDSCTDCTIYADPTRMQQVFWNLLKNAVKFTPPGGQVRIRCHCEHNQLITEVSDTGEGIEPHLLPRIFNAFEQGGARVTRQFGGLGLGLTITRGVVELHGGTIQAHSDGKGKGARFVVRLPMAEVASAERGSASGVTQASPSEHTSAAPPAPIRILLVEDHGDTARIMRRLLAARGYQVDTAGDVATALDLAHSKPFDLLLSDLGLPDGSGVDLMRQLREEGQTLPGIALSGFGQEEDIRRTKAAGFAVHLTKPTSPEILTQTIASVTQQA